MMVKLGLITRPSDAPDLSDGRRGQASGHCNRKEYGCGGTRARVSSDTNECQVARMLPALLLLSLLLPVSYFLS